MRTEKSRSTVPLVAIQRGGKFPFCPTRKERTRARNKLASDLAGNLNSNAGSSVNSIDPPFNSRRYRVIAFANTAGMGR